MRTGLVLGAGGVVGASWLIGALDALSSETGWDPHEADHIIGTSAGSVIGALIAEGLPPEYLAAYASGRTADEVADADARAHALMERLGGRERLDELAATTTGDDFRLHRGLPLPGPGSLRMGMRTALKPWRHPPAALVAGWLPRGFVSTGPISDLVETFVQGSWPDHPGYWAVAADYCTGKRVPFGRGDTPAATVGQAVAASCAIPGFYHPVKIAGKRYVDGGICSMSNVDLLRGRELDLVVVLNPTSSLAEAMGGTPGERAGALMRAASGKRLGHEVRKLRAEGTEVLVLQPDADDVARMGFNLMARGRRVEVMEQARKGVALALRELRGSGRLLPEPHKKVRPARARAARSAPARGGAARGARRSAA